MKVKSITGKKDPHLYNWICDLNKEARDCGGQCNLEYPHENSKHDCKKAHKCDKECSYKLKVKGCIKEGKCNLPYNHQENEQHDCRNEHKFKEKCFKNCDNDCFYLFYQGPNHECGENQNFCKKNCPFIDNSRNCLKICKRDYDHSGECICDLKTKDSHICNKKCKICNSRDCILKVGHQKWEMYL